MKIVKGSVNGIGILVAEMDGGAVISPQKSSSRREEALIKYPIPKKLEPRYLGCYQKEII
jgi:hypothetical protein